MKAIIIDEPWISLILSGQKTWEMRKGVCKLRGAVALIRKGSGQVVGVARIVNSLHPLESADAYAEAEPQHRIPRARQDVARRDGWTTPWVLADARPLTDPIFYRHPYGAVIWVNLDPEVAAAISAQIDLPAGDGGQIGRVKPSAPVFTGEVQGSQALPAELAVRPSAEHRIVTVTGGNLRNNHIYLPLEFFPAEAIGGKNKAEVAPRQLTVTFRPGSVAFTDIDGTKRIFRSRAEVGDFLARAGVVEGDQVAITRDAQYTYSIEKYENNPGMSADATEPRSGGKL